MEIFPVKFNYGQFEEEKINQSFVYLKQVVHDKSLHCPVRSITFYCYSLKGLNLASVFLLSICDIYYFIILIFGNI